ncbi:hypothetical protein D3C81_1863980 [compost metagenome]
MQQTPDNKGPAGPVPNTADYKSDHQIEIGARNSFSIAPKRDINIILQKSAQSHMPTPPEILYADSFIRRIKVNGQLNIKE